MKTVLPSLFAVVTMCLLSAGCSTDRTEGTRSVEDSMAEMQRARDSFNASPAGASADAGGTAESTGTAAGTGTFRVKFETSAGDFVVEVHREWAPLGAQRFYELVKSGFYDECRFFRVVPGFMVQFGISGDPSVQRRWERSISDDPVQQSNKKGYVTFATSGPNSRTTQIFVNYADNHFLDSQGFSPFGEVIEGMHNVEGIFSGYGETPDQGRITAAGNNYLKSAFPDLDYVRRATILEDGSVNTTAEAADSSAGGR